MKKRKSVKCRIVSFFMAVLLCIGMVQVNSVDAQAADEPDTRMDSTDMADHLVGNASYVQINGVNVSTGSAISVPYGETVKVHLEWSFVDQHFPTADSHTMTYQLPDGIDFAKDSDTLDGYGTYTVEGNTVTVNYEKESFYTGSNRSGSLDIEGKLCKEALDDGKGGKTTYKFLGLGDFTIDMRRDESGDGIHVKKTGGKVNEKDMTSAFLVEITATGKQSNVVVTDTLQDNLTLQEKDISFYTDAACKNAYTGTVTGSVAENKKGFSYTIAEMADGETIYAAYHVTVDRKIYLYDKGDAKWQGNNTVEVKSETSHAEATKGVEIGKKSDWAKKTGTIEGKGKCARINWTITINPNGEKMDLGGSVISDWIDGDSCSYIKKSFSCKPEIPGLKESTWENVLNGETFTLPKGTDQTYTISYQTTAGTVKNHTANTKKNTFSIKIWDEKTFEYSDTVTIGKNFDYIQKQCLTKNPQSDTVEWKITAKIPEGIQWKYSVTDYLPKGMTYVPSSAKCSFKNSIHLLRPKINTGKKGEISFSFGPVSSGTIEITFQTKINKIPEKSTSYTNRVSCFDDGNWLAQAQATYRYTCDEPMTKDVDWKYWKESSPYTSWKLAIKPLSRMQNDKIKHADTITIVDTLPENTMYVEGSAEVYTDDWNRKQKIEGIQARENGDGTVTFQLTGKALETVNTNTPVYVFYQTKIKDVSLAFEKNHFINKAKITINGITYPEVEKDAWKHLSKEDIISKTGNYEKNTKPVDYTITVNANAQDLDPESDTLTLVDTMGSALDYVMGSLKIDGTQATGEQVVYDQTIRTLTVKVPDSKKVVVTYQATVNLSPLTDGKQNYLDESNAKNTCKLMGVHTDQGSSSYTIKHKVVSSKGTSKMESVCASVYKYAAGDQTAKLAGVTFTCSELTFNRKTGEVTKTKELAEKQTDKDGYAVFDGLNRNILYKITETKTIDGYDKVSEPSYFIFRESGNRVSYPKSIRDGNQTYSFTIVGTDTQMYQLYVANQKHEEKPKSYPVFISKVDAANSSELAGAKLVVKHADTGETIASWTSGDDGKNADGTIKLHKLMLQPGKYTLTETAAPDGYVVAETISFTVGNDGNVIGFGGNQIVMKDQKKSTPPTPPSTPSTPPSTPSTPPSTPPTTPSTPPTTPSTPSIPSETPSTPPTSVSEEPETETIVPEKESQTTKPDRTDKTDPVKKTNLDEKDNVPKTGVQMTVSGIWKVLFVCCAAIASLDVIVRMWRRKKTQ